MTTAARSTPPFESPAVVPTHIGPEAWEAAMILHGAVEDLLKTYGFTAQRDRASGSIPVMAKLVQHAINMAVANAGKVDA